MFETGFACGEFGEVFGGVDEEVPDEEPFELIMVFFCGAGGLEFAIKSFEGGEDVEDVGVECGFMEDGIGGFVIEVERFIYGSVVIGMENQGRHQFHIFVDDAFFEFKIMLLPPGAFNNHLPGAEAVTDEAAFVIWSGGSPRIGSGVGADGYGGIFIWHDGGKITGAAVCIDAGGAEHDEVGTSLLGALHEFSDGAFGNFVIRIDEPEVVAVGFCSSEVAGGASAECITM